MFSGEGVARDCKDFGGGVLSSWWELTEFVTNDFFVDSGGERTGSVSSSEDRTLLAGGPIHYIE